ncbi:hypothetical protein vseg_007423 [Gypsophila vaccaria]
MKMKDKVLQSGYYLFDNKPLIFKAWKKDLELRKADVKSVPAWIQLHHLPLKFWGKILPKITGLVGKYIKSDAASEERTKLGFARVMVELMVDQQFPTKVSFKDEKGEVIQVEVEYEWKPVTCSKCMGMGHQQENCRKGGPQKTQQKAVKKVWRPAVKAIEEVQKLEVTGKGVLTNNTPPQPKKLVQLHKDKGDGGQDGYCTNSFVAFSYKDVLSPTARVINGNVQSTNIPHGYPKWN